MNYLEIILLSIAISMGSFKLLMDAAVSHCYNHNERFKISIVFALFKSLFFLLGFLITSTFSELVWESRTIIVIAIFLVLGLKMIFDATKLKPGERSYQLNVTLIMILISVAANIDGFIAGIGFAFCNTDMISVALFIFIFTLFFAWNALYYGEKRGNYIMASRVNIAGGLLLVAYSLFVFFDKTGAIF